MNGLQERTTNVLFKLKIITWTNLRSKNFLVKNNKYLNLSLTTLLVQEMSESDDIPPAGRSCKDSINDDSNSDDNVLDGMDLSPVPNKVCNMFYKLNISKLIQTETYRLPPTNITKVTNITIIVSRPMDGQYQRKY